MQSLKGEKKAGMAGTGQTRLVYTALSHKICKTVIKAAKGKITCIIYGIDTHRKDPDNIDYRSINLNYI